MSQNSPSWGTIAEAAELKKISVKSVRRYITAGLIRAERVGPRLIRVDLTSLDSLGTPLQFVGGDHGDDRN